MELESEMEMETYQEEQQQKFTIAFRTTVPNLIVHFGYCWSSVDVDVDEEVEVDGQ
ncbi:GM17813 [Drosophila sechellia]|uniref:GM17813 n=1 Tax=Drosophila sechellia TaxID=7238 RepID=B4IJH4_DROSE|nr:GM17813 [Drosophila sechellia]